MAIEDSAATMSRLAFFADAIAACPEEAQALKNVFLEPTPNDENPPTSELKLAITLLANKITKNLLIEKNSHLAIEATIEELAFGDSDAGKSAANALRWASGHYYK